MNRSLIFCITALLIGQSEDATLTIYKDGTALIKQPVGWAIPSGNSYVTWNSLPIGIHRDTPFLNLEGVTIISLLPLFHLWVLPGFLPPGVF